MGEVPSDFIPVLRSQGNRTAGPTLRFNPKNGVATLSLEAWKRLGQPETVGLYTNKENSVVAIVGNPPDSMTARKLSKKRTFTASFLRKITNGSETSHKWEMEFPENSHIGIVEVEEEQ